MTQIDALNTIASGWTESYPGGLLCNPNAGGGIIDRALVSKEWFIIFNDDRPALEGFDSRDDAIEAFAIASRKRSGAPEVGDQPSEGNPGQWR